MDGAHDVVELVVHLVLAPVQTDRVLCHFQTRCGYAAGVDSLARCEELMGSYKLVHSLGGASHVAHLCHAERMVGQYLVGIFAVELVLGGTGQIDVCLYLPGFLALHKGRAGELVCVGCTDVVAAGTQFEHIFYLFTTDALRVVDVAVGTAERNDFSPQLGSFLGGTPCHVAKARQRYGLAGQFQSVLLHHVVDEVECAVSGSFRTQDRATPFHALAGEHTLVAVREFLVFAEEITDFAASYADVASRNILIGTDIAIELVHESLAEAHDFGIAASAGRKV